MDRRSLLLKYIYLCTEQVYNYKPLIILTVRFIDKKNIAYVRKITKNCTVCKLVLLGVKVYINDKRGGLVF